MKRRILTLALTVALALGMLSWASAEEPAAFTLESEALGFSLTLPGLSAAEVAVEITGNTVSFYHVPSRSDTWQGLLCVLAVVTPRSRLFSGDFDSGAYSIIAMGEDRVYLKRALTGIDAGEDTRTAFLAAAEQFSLASLRENLLPAEPAALPEVDREARLPYLPVAEGRVRPGEAVTRGELADMLCALLGLTPTDGDTAASEAGEDGLGGLEVLAGYGIFSGYPDGSLRPEGAVTRAELAVLLHRFQLAAPMGRYGETSLDNFSDVSDYHWAAAHLYSACAAGWLTGYPDGTFRPSQAVTRAEAVTALNRVLGRDEAQTAVAADLVNPFADLVDTSWAYANMLEAAGLLVRDLPDQARPLPEGTSASCFAGESDGWAAVNGQLMVTADGGDTWQAVGTLPDCEATGLFFFPDQRGVLAGRSGEGRPVLLAAETGGWRDLLTDADFVSAYFPAEQFPGPEAMLDAIVSLDLCPAGAGRVYLDVTYRPYESVYPVEDGMLVVRRTLLE